MLKDALYYKDAFIRLKTSNRSKYTKITPNDDEWKMATTVFQCLKKFYDLTVLLSGISYPTANLFYRGFCEIKELLDNWCLGADFTIKQMAIAMSEEFEKYWTCSSMSLAVACFLDPRYKKKLLEYYMRKFYGDYYQIHLDEFLTVVKNLYQFYASSSSKNKSDVNQNEHLSPTDPLAENRDDELESFLYDDHGPDSSDTNELDKYMAEPLLKQNPFDILSYWTNNTDKYPILSQIARDMMAIQVSTVASESVFSGAGWIIDPYRNRLDLEIVQALICTKDWVHAARKCINWLICSIRIFQIYVMYSCTVLMHMCLDLSFFNSKSISLIVADFKPPETIPMSSSHPTDDEVFVYLSWLLFQQPFLQEKNNIATCLQLIMNIYVLKIIGKRCDN